MKSNIAKSVFAAAMLVSLGGCAVVDVPNSRSVNVPSPQMAEKRRSAVNERPDSVMYLPLGEDILVPEIAGQETFPQEMVGPFELRGETLAGALQLILAEYDMSIAFETREGLTRRITVANLHGELGRVVNQVCSLANLYCSFENGGVVVKDSQTFTVTLPPIGARASSSGGAGSSTSGGGGGSNGDDYLQSVADGLAAILSAGASQSEEVSEPIIDRATRTIVYTATQRTAEMASRYFQRLRANTAMIVFETYIWEVALNSGNSTGIDWSMLEEFGKFNTGISINGSISSDFTNPISIGLPTTSGTFTGTSGDIIQFLSQFGAVKTISQPQITVLSGAEAQLRVADTQNYVSQVATTLSEGQATTSVNTDSVDTGFTLSIGSSWDKSTVYANVDIELTDVQQIDNFAFSDSADPDDPDNAGTQTRIQLPQTSERELSTQIRVRPGDSVLIAGLVRENDSFDERGPGIMEPIIPDSRTAETENLELVVLLRPRVIVYTALNDTAHLEKHMPAIHSDTNISLSAPREFENIVPNSTMEEVKPASVQASSTEPEPVEAPAITPLSDKIASPPHEENTSLDISPPAPMVKSSAPSIPVTTQSAPERFRRGGGFSSSEKAPPPLGSNLSPALKP